MIASLVGKELRQHWIVFLLVVLTLMLGFLVLMAWGIDSDSSAHPYEIMQRFLVFFSVTGALVLCNRLVVAEYAAKTQLFLEALPLTRATMITVKYLIGAFVFLFATGLLFGMATLMAMRVEELNTRHVGIVLLRTVSIVLFLYSFFFMMGLLGRYRVAIYLLILIGLVLLDNFSEIDLANLGPFHLLTDVRFAFERNQIPWDALTPTWLMTAGFIIVTLLLSLVREGSVATLLAEKMSYREKVFIACLIIAAMMAMTIYESKVVREPYDLVDAIEASQERVQVKVSGFGSEENRSRVLAERVSRELNSVAEYLGLEEFPPVFIVLRQDLDADKFERGEIEKAEGVLVRANFANAEWEHSPFAIWLIREVLINLSEGIELRESKRWVLDGFPLYWASLQNPPMLDRQRIELRAAFGGRNGGFTSKNVDDWLTYRNQVGDSIASAVAYVGLQTIADQTNDSTCHKFLEFVLHDRATEDVRVFYNEWVHSVKNASRSVLNSDRQTVVSDWVEVVSRLVEKNEDSLSELPRLGGTIDLESLSSETRSLDFAFQSTPPPADGWFELRHIRLDPFEMEIDEYKTVTEKFLFNKDANGEAYETFSRGDRLAWTFVVDVERLGCEVITGWKYQEVE